MIPKITNMLLVMWLILLCLSSVMKTSIFVQSVGLSLILIQGSNFRSLKGFAIPMTVIKTVVNTSAVGLHGHNETLALNGDDSETMLLKWLPSLLPRIPDER